MKNLKSCIVTMFSILLLSIAPIISRAEQRMITFEMGESSHTVSFPMSQKEILEAEKIDEVIEKIKQRKRNKQRMTESYELAESGITIIFPMSDEEISEAEAQYQELVNRHEKMSELRKEMEKMFDVFEMGESGQPVRFLRNSSQ
ncbi:MAG: hypothetical protein GQ542_11660 [Desulforhopalus sp.]|nr:hypothetical protein [Desulforhopalus sp.]